MRRLSPFKFVLAFAAGIVFMLSLPAAGPFGPTVPALRDDAPALLSARLVDSTGKPAAGVLVLVNAWPKEVAADLAARASIHAAGYTRTDDTGDLVIALAPDETLAAIAAGNGGRVNLELAFFAGDGHPAKGLGAYTFSAELLDGVFTPAGEVGQITIFP